MKKTLLALAVLGATALSAQAADVTVYGRMDLGFDYLNTQMTETDAGVETKTKSHSFGLNNGNSTGSRFGIKGTEDLGNGMKVGFVLENGFKADTGALNDDKRIFDREASLSLSGDFGTVYAGRMGTLVSDAGSVGFYAGAVSPFGSGWSKISGHTALFANYTSRLDNVVTYVSPDFAGAKVYAQYGMGDQGEENTSNTNRYAALGASYKLGALELASVLDYTNKKTANVANSDKVDDAFTFNVGGSYDFGVVKAFAAAQYFKDAADVASILTDLKETGATVGAKGYGLNVGVTAPVLGGTALLSAGYMDGEIEDKLYAGESDDVKAYALSAGYTYNLSKRTSVYAGAGYTYREIEGNDQWKTEWNTYQVMSGLVHKF